MLIASLVARHGRKHSPAYVELLVMLLCHYRHLILVDTSRHRLIKGLSPS